MGFVLTIVYLYLSYLTPVGVFGWEVAPLHLELVLAMVVLFASVTRLHSSFVASSPQFLAVLGLCLAVFASVLARSFWVGGATYQVFEFIPWIYAYVLVCLHMDSVRRMQLSVLMISFVCLWIAGHGLFDLMDGIPAGGPPISQATGSVAVREWNAQHPYLYVERGAAGWIYRLRAPLGEINDPNDFAQLCVCAIPLQFMFWKRRSRLRNLFTVLLPVAALIAAVYLTHSRGALLALLAMTLLAMRRRFGIVPAMVLAFGLFAAATASGFTGGRQISLESGADRTALWSQGLTMVKSYPCLGVGFGQFASFAGHTAHNSVVVCVAELGLVGFYFWSLFLFCTLRNALTLASERRVSEPSVPTENSLAHPLWTTKPMSKDLVNRMGQLLLVSVTGFLVAGWFLSRSFVMTFFFLGGLTDVLFQMARRRGMVPPRPGLARTLLHSFWTMVGLLTGVYVMLRVINVVG